MRKFLKNHTVLFAIIILILSCSRPTYTSSKYFDCAPVPYDTLSTDTTQIIYQALLHSCVEKKDIPDFELLKDNSKIYVANILFKTSFSRQDTTNYRKFRNIQSIPTRIENVQFCLKSFNELRHIADKVDAFLYIQLGHITINGDMASVGVSTNWMLPSNSKRLVMSGGGYIANLKKIDDKWKVVGKENDWIS